jgi:glycerate 2-kinase
MDPRRTILLTMFQAALARADGRAAVRAALKDPGWRAGRHAVIAIGKAAPAMLLGARDALGGAIDRAIVITKAGHAHALERSSWLEVCESAHPLPDERSVGAGSRLFAWIDALPAGLRALVLVSGGASSLVELPRAGVTLQDLQRLNERGLRAGLDIAALNAERARLSRIKAGGLSARLAGRAGVALFLSDVPGDDPALIGSGLAGPVAPVPGPAPQAPDCLERRVIATIDEAVNAAAACAAGFGFTVDRLAARISGDAQRTGGELARRLLHGAATAMAAGGETVVQLPAAPGRGGRNQHLALAAAVAIAGSEAAVLLAAGTDGDDGPTGDAGGLVDGHTCERIALAGGDASAALRAADTGSALEAAGDLVHTGPTATNVGDLVLGLRVSTIRASELLNAHDGPPAVVV